MKITWKCINRDLGFLVKLNDALQAARMVDNFTSLAPIALFSHVILRR